MRAGLIGAAAPTRRHLANDSGALLLEIGAAYLLVFAASPGRGAPAGGPLDQLPLMPRAHCPCLAIFLDVSGRRQPARRGARRGVSRPWPPRARARPPSTRPAGSVACCTGEPPSSASCRLLTPLGRTIGHRLQRRDLQSRAFPRPVASLLRAVSCAGATTTSSTSTSRWCRWSAGARCSAARRRPSAPSTPTRPKAMPNHIASALGARRVFNRLSARIAVSEAAAWTGRRWFGGHYEIVPNGVDVDAAPCGQSRPETSCGCSSSVARRSARACPYCSAPSALWPSTCPAG